jgi:WD40 repeat protein
VWAIAFSPDGRLMASGSDDTTAKIWDMETRTCRHTLVGHHGSIWAIAFSPDGTQLVTGSNDQTIRLWDVALGALLQTIYGHESTIWDVAFRGSDEIISASQSGVIKIWDLTTGKCKATLRDIRPYEGMNLTNSTGLTDAQKSSLADLGAIV